MSAKKKPNWIIKAGSLTREEDGKPVTYERGAEIYLSEQQAERFGVSQLQRIGEADVNNRADSIAEMEELVKADREALDARKAELDAREKDLQAREDALADAEAAAAEAKAKADAEAKAAPKK